MYAPHRLSLYVRPKLTDLQGEINEYTIIVGNLKVLYQKWTYVEGRTINKGIVELKSTDNQLHVIDIYEILDPKRAEHAVFSSSHGTFTKIDHILSRSAI